jgi:hypothetical protein
MVNPTPLRPKPKANGGVPDHLAKEEGELFAKICRSYALHDEVSRQILAEGLTSLQRAREARQAIDKEGVSFKDRWGQPKPHPLCNVERDARAAALSAFRMLNLEMPRPKSKEIIDF